MNRSVKLLILITAIISLNTFQTFAQDKKSLSQLLKTVRLKSFPNLKTRTNGFAMIYLWKRNLILMATANSIECMLM